MSEWEKSWWRAHGSKRVRESVPEHAKEHLLAFKTTPHNTLFEGAIISLLLKKVATLDWSDG